MASSGKQALVGRRERTSLKAPAGKARLIPALFSFSRFVSNNVMAMFPCSPQNPAVSQRSNAKTYVTSGCQCLENLGPVVQKQVNANLGLKVNQGFCFSC